MNGADLAVLVVPFLDGTSNRVEAGTDLEVTPSSVLVSLGLARQPAVHIVCDVEQCVVCCDTIVCVGVVRACTATRCAYCV